MKVREKPGLMKTYAVCRSGPALKAVPHRNNNDQGHVLLPTTFLNFVDTAYPSTHA